MSLMGCWLQLSAEGKQKLFYSVLLWGSLYFDTVCDNKQCTVQEDKYGTGIRIELGLDLMRPTFPGPACCYFYFTLFYLQIT